LGALVSDTKASDVGFSTGATIVEVTEGGAADSAGLTAGDVVIEFDGKRVETASDLTALVRSRPAGSEVELRFLRNGAEVRLMVTLGNAADLG
jgi:S1-C subfamily serine protease